MSRSRPGSRKVVFVTPRPVGESMRATRAVGTLDDVVVLGVTEGLPDPGAADAVRDLTVVGDTHDSGQWLTRRETSRADGEASNVSSSCTRPCWHRRPGLPRPWDCPA